MMASGAVGVKWDGVCTSDYHDGTPHLQPHPSHLHHPRPIHPRHQQPKHLNRPPTRLTANTYTYVNGDPINYNDPTGHMPCDQNACGSVKALVDQENQIQANEQQQQEENAAITTIISPGFPGRSSTSNGASISSSTLAANVPGYLDPFGVIPVGQSISLGVISTLLNEANARSAYQAGLESISEESQMLLIMGAPPSQVAQAAVEARNALRAQIRADYSSLGSLYGDHSQSFESIEARYPGDYEAIISSASRSSSSVDAIAAGARYTGYLGILFNVGLSAYQIASAPPYQRAEVAGEDVGALAGALGGAEVGAEGGAEGGALVAGPMGAAVGGLVGSLGGAIAGGIAGSEVGRWFGKQF